MVKWSSGCRTPPPNVMSITVGTPPSCNTSQYRHDLARSNVVRVHQLGTSAGGPMNRCRPRRVSQRGHSNHGSSTTGTGVATAAGGSAGSTGGGAGTTLGGGGVGTPRGAGAPDDPPARGSE